VAEGGAEAKVDVVGRNKPADLMFIVPQGLAPGDYTLEVRAVAHGSDEVRSGALDAVLTVA
jgi:hypothetical protein